MPSMNSFISGVVAGSGVEGGRRLSVEEREMCVAFAKLASDFDVDSDRAVDGCCAIHRVPLEVGDGKRGCGACAAGTHGAITALTAGGVHFCVAEVGQRVLDVQFGKLRYSSESLFSYRSKRFHYRYFGGFPVEPSVYGRGYCYLSPFHECVRSRVARILGPNPLLVDVVRLLHSGYTVAGPVWSVVELGEGLFHLELAAEGVAGAMTLDRLMVHLMTLCVHNRFSRVGGWYDDFVNGGAVEAVSESEDEESDDGNAGVHAGYESSEDEFGLMSGAFGDALRRGSDDSGCSEGSGSLAVVGGCIISEEVARDGAVEVFDYGDGLMSTDIASAVYLPPDLRGVFEKFKLRPRAEVRLSRLREWFVDKGISLPRCVDGLLLCATTALAAIDPGDRQIKEFLRMLEMRGDAAMRWHHASVVMCRMETMQEYTAVAAVSTNKHLASVFEASGLRELSDVEGLLVSSKVNADMLEILVGIVDSYCGAYAVAVLLQTLGLSVAGPERPMVFSSPAEPVVGLSSSQLERAMELARQGRL